MVYDENLYELTVLITIKNLKPSKFKITKLEDMEELKVERKNTKFISISDGKIEVNDDLKKNSRSI